MVRKLETSLNVNFKYIQNINALFLLLTLNMYLRMLYFTQ